MSPRGFLLVGHDAGGTVPPMLALAEGLIARGHDVVVLDQPSVRKRAEAAGCTFAAFSDIPDYARDTALEDQLDVVLTAMTHKTAGDNLIEQAERHRVDAVVVDANLGGALAAAEQLDRPSAVLLHSMYKTYVDVWFGETWPFLEPGINATRQSYGLAPADDWPAVFAGHERMLSVVPSAFDAPVDVVPDAMRHFGFLVPRGAPPATVSTDYPPGDEPTVLVGLSTTYQGQRAMIETIVDALAGLAVRALVTTAGQVDADELPQPANVTITDFAPHTALLDHTDVMVTHAGLGTVAGALSYGVPLVCTPVSRDQPLNAQRVADLGAGVALSGTPDAAEIATAVERVLATPAFAEAARSLASAGAAEGGTAAAAAELEALLG